MNNTSKVELLTEGFIEAMVFANDEECYGVEISEDARTKIKNICEQFYKENMNIVDFCVANGDYENYESVGNYLYFTLDGHGVGFWEHENGKPLDSWVENFARNRAINPYAHEDKIYL